MHWLSPLPFRRFGATVLLGMGSAAAQTLEVIHAFDGTNGGRNPQAALVVRGNALYGATDSGGEGHSGTFFKLNPDGTGFTILHHFGRLIAQANPDGAYPDSTPVLSGDTMYGTAYDGGLHGYGTVFKLRTDGTGFSVLHHFSPTVPDLTGARTNAGGANPESGLVVAEGVVLGTTENGGTAGLGAVFRVGIDGTGFANLHSFTSLEGDTPEALVLAGGKLYGTAAGMKSGRGAVFRLGTDGTGFEILHSFVATNYAPAMDGPGLEPAYANADGVLPASLMVSASTLYGTTYWGGANGNGTVFRMQLDGSGFKVLHHFDATQPNSSGAFTNRGGAHPIQFSGLQLWGNTLFGTTFLGGNSGNGTLFALRTDGTGFVILHEFSATTGPGSVNSDGALPFAGLTVANGRIYGTTRAGGAHGGGTIFRLALPPQLAVAHTGERAVLTWPQSATGYTLQSADSLVLPVAWKTVSQAPVVVNGFNTVLVPAAPPQQFYRLRP